MTLRFRSWRAVLLGGAVLLLGAGAPPVRAATPAPADGAGVVDDLSPSPLGHYLAGRFAQRSFDYDAAARLYALPLELDPDEPALLNATYLALLAGGKVGDAATLAQRLAATETVDRLADLVLATRAIRDGRWGQASARLDSWPAAGLKSLVAPLLRGWIAVGSGKIDDVSGLVTPLAATKGMSTIVELQLALMYDVAGRPDDAEPHYRKALDTVAQQSLRLVQLAANFYQRQNKLAEAKAVLDKAAAEQQGGGLWLADLRKTLEAGSRVPAVVATTQQGAAEVMFELATILVQQEANDLGLLFGRLALDLRPDLVVAKLLVAEVVAGQGRSEDAIALYKEVPQEGAFGWQARLNAALELDKLGQTDEALRQLDLLATERPDQVEPLLQRANILRSHERFAESAEAYTKALALIPEAKPEHWSVYYFRGIAYERSKQWPRAEADFRKALELQPDQPLVLNYLAYSWVEQGQHLDEALDMLKKAVAGRPNDGYIIDSLGWIYFRLGKYEDAVSNLERAVELKPQDSTINDHLGDAYWKAGRKVEARYQWQRALLFKPDAERVKPIEQKIAKGLDGNSGG
ncbi:MAG: tetratricopeptide repeat protein [Dongiaceae bacterium]